MKREVNFPLFHGASKIINVKDIPLHCSSTIQLIFVLDGEIDLYLSLKTYKLKKGDIFYLHYEDIHGMKGECENRVLILSINPEFACKLYPNILHTTFSTNILDDTIYFKEIRISLQSQLITSAIVFFEKPTLFSEEIKKLLKILDENFKSIYVDLQTGFSFRVVKNTSQATFISDVISKIYRNCNQKVSLAELAEELCVSRDHLSHMFTKYTNLNFRDFLSMVRVEKSLFSLLNGNDSIESISIDSGFSHSNFYKSNFIKWANEDPTQYREKYKDWTIKTCPCKFTLIPYPEAKSNIFFFLSRIYDSTSEAPMFNINFEKLDFSQNLLPLPLKVSPKELTSSDFLEFSMNLDSFASTLFPVDSNTTLFSVIDFQYNFAMQSHPEEIPPPTIYSRQTLLSLDDLINYIVKPFPIPLFSTNSNQGLYDKNSVKTFLFYIYVWLSKFPSHITTSTTYVAGKSKSHYSLIIANCSDSELKEISIEGLSKQDHLIYHYSLHESKFNIIDLVDENHLPPSHVNRCAFPDLKIVSTRKTQNEATKLTLSPRSINGIFITPIQNKDF